MIVWMNRIPHHLESRSRQGELGWFVPAAEALISPGDRGFLLGDGLFETILVRHRRAPLLPFHMARLEAGCRLLRYPEPPPLDRIVPDFIQEAGLQDGVLRLTYTRGPGPRGYKPPEAVEPLCLLGAAPLPPGDEEPWRALLSQVPVVPHPVLSRVKHTSALPRIVAAQEGVERGAHEVLFCTVTGTVSEGTATNVFWVTGDVLFTPCVEETGCLPGVARRWVMEWARSQGLKVEEGAFPLRALLEAEEAFLTNAVRGPIPLGEVVGRRRWPDAPGPLTRRACIAWNGAVASPPTGPMAPEA